MRWTLLVLALALALATDVTAEIGGRLTSKSGSSDILSSKSSCAASRKRGNKTPGRRGRRRVEAEQAVAKTKVALLELDALGLPRDMAESLNLLLGNTLQTMSSVQFISPVDVSIALQRPGNAGLARCGGGPACVVRVGRLVGADVVVFGTISALGDAVSLNLRAQDVAGGRELGRETANIVNRDSLIPEIRLAAYKLIAPNDIVGSLLMEIDADGVEVELDGVVVGVTPLPEAITNIKPGEHFVVLRREGYSEFRQVLSIRPFETTKLKLALDR